MELQLAAEPIKNIHLCIEVVGGVGRSVLESGGSCVIVPDRKAEGERGNSPRLDESVI